MWEKLWIASAAFAGAVTSLAFDSQRALAIKGKIFTVFIGATFAIYVGPAVIRWLFGNEPADSQLVGALYYVMSVSAMVIIPIIIKAISDRASSTVGGLVKHNSVRDGQ